MDISFESLIDLVSKYNISGIAKIRKAYSYAADKHDGQYRESGEPYINHPLAVAILLASLNADTDTICAGLLHDIIEDTNATKKDIAEEFGEPVAILVEGVTNLTKKSISDKSLQDNANLCKLINLGIYQDARILIIKLADRLHNMMTLQYKKDTTKQQKKAIETLDFYVPIADFLGLHRFKNDLEDRCFFSLKPDEYQQVTEMRRKYEKDVEEIVEETIQKINFILDKNDIPNSVYFRLKSAYGIFKDLVKKHPIDEILDLLVFKIIVDDIDDCYLALRYIHEIFKPLPGTFEDYIAVSMPNGGQELRTGVLGFARKIMQMRMKTADMEKYSQYGVTNLWHDVAAKSMQDALTKGNKIYTWIDEAMKMSDNDQEFLTWLKWDVFAEEKVRVITKDGDVIDDLPKGSTIIDFAYRIHTEIGNSALGATVNGNLENLDYVLKDGDKIGIITDQNAIGPTEEWLSIAKTARAKKKIREYLNKQKRSGQSLIRTP